MTDSWDADEEPKVDRYGIGQIEYNGHPPATIRVPRQVTATYSADISPMPRLPGVYVPSHRPLYLHQPVSDIPLRVDAREQLFRVYLAEIQNLWKPGRNNPKALSPTLLLKRSLLSLATYGYPSETIEPNDAARSTFEGFQRTLSTILPEDLGFRKIRVRVPDVLLDTDTGLFAIDAVSGGIAALIDIAWQVYLYSTLETNFVVAIDEPEAHLHPALQRTVLPKLMLAFPQAQFIVATHNPLVVGSSEEFAVYVLRYNAARRVHALLLDKANKAGTANELLRDVLGLETTSAVWVERALDSVLEHYRDRELSVDTLEQLRGELKALGLSRYLPQAIDELKQ